MAIKTSDWQSIFETGHKEVDEQHMQLFQLIKDFSNAFVLKKAKQDITNTLFKLEDYAKMHFDFEENELAKYGNPPSKKHIEQHKQFLITLRDLKFDYVSENKPIEEELFNYITDWLRDHILGIDMDELKEI